MMMNILTLNMKMMIFSLVLVLLLFQMLASPPLMSLPLHLMDKSGQNNDDDHNDYDDE